MIGVYFSSIHVLPTQYPSLLLVPHGLGHVRGCREATEASALGNGRLPVSGSRYPESLSMQPILDTAKFSSL